MTDVVIIGSGIAGLSCGALLAKYGFEVVVCESHSIPGGAAHGFERQGFQFDSGPSLYSGLSYSPSPNPLRQVLDVLEVDVPWLTYDRWGCFLPEGNFDTTVGTEQFCQILADIRGKTAVRQWRNLQQMMQPLAEAAVAIPPLAIRLDWQAIFTVGQFLPQIIRQSRNISKLTGNLSSLLEGVITDSFIRNWLDLLCFLLSGLPADGTIAAEVAFMFAEWYRPGAVLDYPQGGSAALVAALVRGLEINGGKLLLNSHVAKILLKNSQAVGVQLKNGKKIQATRAVISNASIWDTLKLIPIEQLPPKLAKRKSIPQCESFMHLHLGINGDNLPANLACHHIVVNDWTKGINAAQNVVLISIPSLLDRNLAPQGKHTIHVYTPANEPYAIWQDIKRNTPEYELLKQNRAEVMWQALARVIPDIRSRCELILVGTPLTHQRFLRRDRGTYGPAISPQTGLFPSCLTSIPSLLCCGDSTFPGIGLPAVAASGAIAANTLASLKHHQQMLKQIGLS
ncbi:MAG: NAD(P)/FAD-dependent oxidoreductase [Cyanobacteria bacterium J083]|nr:MAG: NAD(P)/FAD-dependent oxidoreductase [Cyanobacteria bacterium J083]